MKKAKHEFAAEFVTSERRKFKWALGKLVASSLSGFVAGLIIASLLFYALFDLTWKGFAG